jgi:cytochrome P450
VNGLTSQIQDRRDAAAFHLNLSRMGGEVVSYRLGSRQAHLVNTPALAEWVLERNEGNYENPPHPYAELGLYYTDAGCTLLRLDRRGLDRARSKHTLAEGLRHEAAATAEQLIAQSGDGPVDVAAVLEPMVFRYMCRALFDVDGREPADEFVRAVGLLEQCLANDIVPRAGDPLAQAYADAISVQDGTTEWLARAAGIAQPDEPLPERRRTAIVRTVMNGYNATATALTWTLHLLAQHRSAQARVHAEIDQAESDDPGQSGSYLRMVVMEALRLYPPAWILARVARCPDRLGATDIAAGDVVSVSPYTMQRSSDVWPTPNRFDPERFTAAATRERPAYAYFPFGGGARRCTAASHMISQLQVALATLLRRCEVAPEPGTNVRPRGLVALHPTPAVRLHFCARG